MRGSRLKVKGQSAVYHCVNRLVELSRFAAEGVEGALGLKTRQPIARLPAL